MKTAFWLSSDPIGHDVRCPRDGRMGCALVDWIPSAERREQTHFMSWTWQYSLMQVETYSLVFVGQWMKCIHDLKHGMSESICIHLEW